MSVGSLVNTQTRAVESVTRAALEVDQKIWIHPTGQWEKESMMDKRRHTAQHSQVKATASEKHNCSRGREKLLPFSGTLCATVETPPATTSSQ